MIMPLTEDGGSQDTSTEEEVLLRRTCRECSGIMSATAVGEGKFYNTSHILNLLFTSRYTR